MEKFTPNARQQQIIEEGLEEHRKAQRTSRPAPERLIRKWNSEAGISSPDTPTTLPASENATVVHTITTIGKRALARLIGQ